MAKMRGRSPATQNSGAPGAIKQEVVFMKALASTMVAAPAAMIASAVPAQRPRPGERALRLGSLLPEGISASHAKRYAFVFFRRESEGEGATYYAAPDASVHADAKLCIAGKGAAAAVAALPRVCGGGGPDNNDGGYPDEIVVGDARDGFDDAGLELLRVFGAGDEYEDKTADECEKAARAFAEAAKGAVYTQIDGGNAGEALYGRGPLFVNRTGIYAVARRASAEAGDPDVALRTIACEVAAVAGAIEAGGAVRDLKDGVRLAGEAAHDAGTGISPPDLSPVLGRSVDALLNASTKLRIVADHAATVADIASSLSSGLRALSDGRCPVDRTLSRMKLVREYTDGWYDLSEAERESLRDAGDDPVYYTAWFAGWLEWYNWQVAAHGKECTHNDCAARRTEAAAGASQGAGETGRSRPGKAAETPQPSPLFPPRPRRLRGRPGKAAETPQPSPPSGSAYR